MIHGVGLDHTMWGPQMPALEEAFCVLRYDMLGHGQSEARSKTLLPLFGNWKICFRTSTLRKCTWWDCQWEV